MIIQPLVENAVNMAFSLIEVVFLSKFRKLINPILIADTGIESDKSQVFGKESFNKYKLTYKIL
jgi:hypothetical protein